MGRIIPHAFGEFYGIVCILIIWFDHHNVHARLTSGLRVMVEPSKQQNDWRNSPLVIAHRDYRDYPLHANNFFVDVETP